MRAPSILMICPSHSNLLTFISIMMSGDRYKITTTSSIIQNGLFSSH
jgi:hypothetical protein